MKICKQEGFTPTEKLLSRLCENTFLDLFSYLNPVKGLLGFHDENPEEVPHVKALLEVRLFLSYVVVKTIHDYGIVRWMVRPFKG